MDGLGFHKVNLSRQRIFHKLFKKLLFMHNVAMERNHQIFGRGRLIKLIYRDKSGLPFGKIFERNVARAAIIRACLGGGGYIFFHSFILILNCLIFFRFCLRFRRFTEHIFYHFQTFQLCGSCQFS